ncbi:hypothetical protein AA313_de0203897 [Arthrobotrys entomopaga]|nr:hypothetical protein AA313_de0203897 [Arthrobotrys entomopaga]
MNTQDSQIIQTLEDNRYYMTLDQKVPWMLPVPQSLVLETTIAIAQVAKNAASISLWIGIKWLKEPKFWKDTISSHALQVLRDDAQDLASIISNEVNKTGPNSKLYKITSQYGQVTIVNDSDDSEISQVVPHGQPSAIMPDFTYSSFFIRDLTGIALQCAKATSRGISIALNLLISSGAIKDMWHDKAALSYIEKIGVMPTDTMKRSITIREIELVTQFGMPRFNSVDGPCFQKFLNVHASMDDQIRTGNEANMQPFSRKLELTRRKLGVYRHDILVALSLINRLEKSVLLSEWEAWVWREKLRCQQAKTALQNSTLLSEQELGYRSTSIESYCHSCERGAFVDYPDDKHAT